MAKGKSSSSGGPHKKHGPKTNRFHSYNKCLRLEFGKSGALSKFTDREAFEQSLNARGIRGELDRYWKDFTMHWSDTPEKQKEFFAQLNKKKEPKNEEEKVQDIA